MITLIDNGVIAKYIGLSTDDKPQEISANIGMKNGSRFLEIDTGDKYYYDADSSQWLKQPSGSGSGGGGITLLATKEYDVSTTSATPETVDEFEVEGSFTSEALIWCRVVDTAGPRVDYFYGTNSFFYNGMPAVAGAPTQSQMDMYPGGQATIRYSTPAGGGKYFSTNTSGLYGVYVQTISPSGVLTVRKNYNASMSTTVDGHYRLDVFRVELPSGEPILPGEEAD